MNKIKTFRESTPEALDEVVNSFAKVKNVFATQTNYGFQNNEHGFIERFVATVFYKED